MARIEFSPALPVLRHTTVIGFGYKARQGKDEAARALESFGAGHVRRFAFSDAIAVLARVSHGMTQRDAIMLQDIGYAQRHTDPGVWVRAIAWAIADWDLDASGPQVAVIAGVRFENEARMIDALGGHLVRVRRWAGGAPFVATDRPADHPTETALDDYAWRHTIDNDDGDLLGFTLAVQALAATLVPSVFHIPAAAGAIR